MLFVPPSIPFMVPEAEASQYEQIVSTSDQTLDIGIYTIPGTPQLKIDFLKPGTETIQLHIDYRVTIMHDASSLYVYCTGGLPCTDILWHTSPGSVTIPLEFSLPSGDPSNGLHTLYVAIEGILFQPIPLETATFTINIVEDDTTPPTFSIVDLTSAVINHQYNPISGFAKWEIARPGNMQVSDNVAIDTNKANYGNFVMIHTVYSTSVEGVFCDNAEYFDWGGGTSDPAAGSGIPFPIGVTTTVNCEVWDTSGNKATASFTVDVIPPDTTPPVIAVPADITITTSNSSGWMYECDPTCPTNELLTNGYCYSWQGCSGTAFPAGIIATDPTDQFGTSSGVIGNGASCDPARDANDSELELPVLYPIGTTTVTCTATDAAGNVGTASFTVTVVLEGSSPIETSQTLSATVYADATSSTGRTLALSQSDMISFLENFPDEDTLYITVYQNGTCGSCSNSQVFHDSYPLNQWLVAVPFPAALPDTGFDGDAGPMSYKLGWRLGDNYGAFRTTLIVGWTGDTTPPVLNMPANQNFSINDADASQSFVFGSTTFVYPSNSTGYYYRFAHISATDDGVVDSPTCMAVAPDGTTWSVPGWTEYAHFNSHFGTTTITCTASDGAGNVGTGSFTLTVVLESGADTTPPVLNMPANQNFSINDAGTSQSFVFGTTGTFVYPANSTGYYYSFTQITATDNVTQWIDPTCMAVAPDGTTWSVPGWTNYGHFNSHFGTTTITCTASDGAGNVGTGSFTLTAILEGAADTTPPEEEIVIPSWIKNNAGWWADGQIDDRAFVSGLQWLISNGIMNIPPTVQGAGSDDVIPSWIKNNAGWWADDLIDDRNFVTGLQWLITNGIMIIELE